MLKSRETLIQDAKNAIKEPRQLAMVLDLIDSAWQWRTGGAQEATRERWVTVGGQTKKGTTTDEAGPKTQDGWQTSVPVVGTAGPQGERGPSGAEGPAGADGKDGVGSVTSIGLSLGPAMEAIADVTNSPVTDDGSIGLELADQPSGKALMSPVSGTGKPSFRTVEFPRLQYATSDPTYLYPDVGNQYMVGTYGSTLVGTFVGHGGDIAEWTGSAWEFTTIPGNPVLVTKSNQVFYRRYGNWFLYWIFSDDFGTPYMNFSGTPLYCGTVRDYSGSGLWKLDATGIEIRTGLTGTNFLSASINLSGHGNFSSVRTGTPSYPSVWTERINALGAGFLTALSISGLTNGKIPRVSTGGGLLTDSAFGDDGTTASVSRRLVITGDRTVGNQIEIGGVSVNQAGAVAFGRAAAGIGAIVGYTTNTEASEFIFNNFGSNDTGYFSWWTRTGNVHTEKMRLTNMGGLQLLKGIGFFGTAAPTSRPNVTGSRAGNAALASLISQLAACGIISDSTT